MLVLCSNGLSSKALTDYITPLIQNTRTAALVVTADNVYKENNYHVPRSIHELEMLGLSVEIFDLDKQPAALLKNYDVIEFIGGNPFYLLHAIRAQNCERILRELSQRKILIGWSAAAFVFGPSLELVNQYTPEMNFLGLRNLTGLGLTQCHVLPHYCRFLHKFVNFEEICHTFERERNVHVFRLNDGDGIFIDENSIEQIYAEQALQE